MSKRVLTLALSGALVSGALIAAPATTATAATATTCGTTIYKADGTPWQCTFSDDFNGTRLDTTKWVPQTNMGAGDVTYACYVNSTSNISTSGGSLHLSVRKVSQPVACGQSQPTYYTAGMVSTYRLFSQQYGRFEARMRSAATTTAGLHEAFWLWPDDRYTTINWPSTGEIDVAETYSQYSNLAVPYLHYTANDNGGPIEGTNTAYCSAQRGTWNTYAVEWTATSIKISVNGQTCLVNNSADPAFNRRYIAALSATLGNGTNAATSGTPIPATTDIDYVRVWR